MPARILIVDSIATNRIVLKVKMTAAQFVVETCTTLAEAEAAIKRQQPDLLIMNLANPAEDGYAFCKAVRSQVDTASLAIIATGIADNAQARFAALDSGADDVLPYPVNDSFLMARIRSLLRIRSVGQELELRDGTRRALGFEEEAAQFQAAAHLVCISESLDARPSWLAKQADHGLRNARFLDAKTVLRSPDLTPTPDVFVVDATQGVVQKGISNLISDLKSRAETRLSAQLIVLGPDQADLAAMCLDLGADDVVCMPVAPQEIAQRAETLTRRKQRHDRLRESVRAGLTAAVTDPLTGLYNRRYVTSHLRRMAEDAAKMQRPFAVMMIDIDHFKSINDTYGHAAGDAILIQLAERLCENLRAVDLIARMGGEEFLVAIPRTSARRANLAADRLRRLVNNEPFTCDSEKRIDVTISIGVAISELTADIPSTHEILCGHADEALYAAKAAGRNQVAMSQSAA